MYWRTKQAAEGSRKEASGSGRSLHNVLLQCEAVVKLQQQINLHYKLKQYLLMCAMLKLRDAFL